MYIAQLSRQARATAAGKGKAVWEVVERDNVQCMLPLGRFGTFVSALGFGFVPKFPIDLIYMQNI